MTITTAFTQRARPRTSPRRRSPARAIAPDLLGPQARQRRVEVLLWAMRHGRTVNPDALTLVLLAKEAFPEPLDRWSEAHVAQIMWVDAVELAEGLGIELPDAVGETFWTALDTFADLGLFAPGSAAIATLREPLRQLAGLDRFGRTRARVRRHPSAR